MDYLKLAIELVVELAALVPLVIQLIKYVKAFVKEKNWSKMLDLTISVLTRAEGMFEEGADKKEWAMAMIKDSADAVNYDYDPEMLSQLIDNLILMTKSINTEIECSKEE